MSPKEKRTLKELLTVKPQDSIFSVIGRMEVLLDFFKRRPKYKNLIPFLETYYVVTRTVAEKRVEKPHFYADAKALEKLDIYFASLYFRPLLTYLTTGRRLAPWNTYFSYCQKQGIPFVQMLLGINAHINTDLALSLRARRYGNRKDFLVINDILEEVIPGIMRFLAFDRNDPFGFGGMIFRKFIRQEFKAIIVKWREQAWKNAKKRKNLGQLTERAGKDITEVFKDITNLEHIREALQRLHSIKV